MDNSKQQLVEKLQSSTNILVTVSSNPSVDQLASCIGLTLLLNKIGKHATAVFSGDIPSTIEFLEPENTLEKNTDSLRDFIISLDKSKADKLRYKVEDKVVKIFITPYRTSLSSNDLEFSQGDFNVDVVLALGVHKQQELDEAIIAHGRILHDATVMTINNTPDGDLGSINWQNTKASSLGELVADLADQLDKNALDEQIATALLTGIVAETARFSNDKTTPRTMSLSAELMAVGANQQLVASKLEEPAKTPDPVEPPQEKPAEASELKETSKEDTPKPKKDDGTLEIAHNEEPTKEDSEPKEAPKNQSAPVIEPLIPALPVDEPSNDPEVPTQHEPAIRSVMTQPPVVEQSPLTANIKPESFELPADPLTLPPVDAAPMLTREEISPLPAPPASIISQIDTPKTTPQNPFPNATNPLTAFQPAFPPAGNNNQDKVADTEPKVADEKPTEPKGPNDSADVKPSEVDKTLSELEASVHATHTTEAPEADVDKARDEVMKALNAAPEPTLEPIAALNAQPMAENINGPQQQVPTPIIPASEYEPAPGALSPADTPLDMPLPSIVNYQQSQAAQVPASEEKKDPNAPPPVPPPMMPF